MNYETSKCVSVGPFINTLCQIIFSERKVDRGCRLGDMPSPRIAATTNRSGQKIKFCDTKGKHPPPQKTKHIKLENYYKALTMAF